MKHTKRMAIAYNNGTIGQDRFKSMSEVIHVVKQLLDRKAVKGIALFNGDEYQEIVPIGGLI